MIWQRGKRYKLKFIVLGVVGKTGEYVGGVVGCAMFDKVAGISAISGYLNVIA